MRDGPDPRLAAGGFPSPVSPGRFTLGFSSGKARAQQKLELINLLDFHL